MAGATPTTAGTGAGGTVAQAGTGGAPTSAGVAGASGATGGQPEPTAGATAGGVGGAPTAGTGSGGTAAGAAGGAGKPATGGNGGSGGVMVDPLEPVPAANCPGYIDVYVPEQTCLWIHGGAFTTQNEACNVINPQSQTCATVTALPKDSQGHYGPRTARLSSDAAFDRVDIASGTAVCPKACN